MRLARLLLRLLLVASCFGGGLRAAASATPGAAAELRATLVAALGSPPSSASPYPLLGPALADYASHAAGDPARFESFAGAARRILAGGSASTQAPDTTALQLREAAHRLQAMLPAGDSTDPVDLDARLTAQLARVHAHRMIAAVHYCLFLRGQRLAELVAATYREKEGVAAYRELVATAAAARHPATEVLRAELKQYELNFKDLEDQCCPPSEATLKERVWQPAAKL